MTSRDRSPLRIVAISAGARQRVSERLRLAALAERTDMELTVLSPALQSREDPTGAQPPTDGFLTVRARRWLPRFESGRVDTVPSLRATLAELRPDVIHVHQEPGSLLALQAVRARDRIAPGAAVLVESEQADMGLTTGPTTHLERHVLKRVDALVVRHKVRLELSRAQGFGGYGAVVGYGVDRRVFHPGLRQASRDALGIAGFTVGYLGRLVPESGLVDVLEAIAASKVFVNLAIRGEGPMRDEILDRAASLDIAERVRIFDPAEVTDDTTFLSALDALAMMRRSGRRWREPFEHVIPEAQACGVPVIASGLSGIPTLVGPGGWIVGERDAGLLARLLHRLVTQPEVTAAVAAAAVTHIGQHGSLDAVTQELRRAFDTAVQARHDLRARNERGWLQYPPLPESLRR